MKQQDFKAETTDDTYDMRVCVCVWVCACLCVCMRAHMCLCLCVFLQTTRDMSGQLLHKIITHYFNKIYGNEEQSSI